MKFLKTHFYIKGNQQVFWCCDKQQVLFSTIFNFCSSKDNVDSKYILVFVKLQFFLTLCVHTLQSVFIKYNKKKKSFLLSIKKYACWLFISPNIVWKWSGIWIDCSNYQRRKSRDFLWDDMSSLNKTNSVYARSTDDKSLTYNRELEYFKIFVLTQYFNTILLICKIVLYTLTIIKNYKNDVSCLKLDKTFVRFFFFVRMLWVVLFFSLPLEIYSSPWKNHGVSQE